MGDASSAFTGTAARGELARRGPLGALVEGSCGTTGPAMSGNSAVQTSRSVTLLR